MNPKKQPPFRYLQAINRAHLAALATAGALVVLPACGGGDKAAFSSSTAAGTETTISADTVASVAETTIPVTTLASESTAAVVQGPTVPASTQMTVNFTYTAEDGGGMVRNPYIAVWVEDKQGNLVQTISVWFLQSQKGERYLQHLRSWYTIATEASAEVTTSGATRPAGTYSVVWDGKGMDGNLVAQGEYVLLIEAAREHGPYSVSSTTLTLSDKGVEVALPDDTELSGMTASVAV